ncbi:uncharacterized protein LOC117317660 isoform X2 [Pecten maximus]|uniref:uncharacterized protein LOC117317660 isoform X2 n=1 Tax=Pecten maximus TaxID=6579 RepID=UPI001458A286|nr:uncharacterized protein LOC117317660 isoform X2 [Pecten maximus]
MSFSRQAGKQYPGHELPVEFSDIPPPLPPRKPLASRVQHLVKQYEPDQFKCRIAELLMSSSNDDVTDSSTTDSFTSLIYDFDIAECSLMNISDSSENDSDIEIDTDLPNTLDDYFENDMFRSDPKNFTPEFREEITTQSNKVPIMTEETMSNLPEMEKPEGPRGLNHYFRQDSIFHVNHEAPHRNKTDNEASHGNKACNFQNNVNESEDNNSNNCEIGNAASFESYGGYQDTPSAYDIYLEKLREFELERNKLEQLLWNKNNAQNLATTSHRKLSSQRSVSESNVFESVNCEDIQLNQSPDEDRSNQNDKFEMAQLLSTDDIQIKTRCNKVKHGAVGMTKFPSLEHITLRAKAPWTNMKNSEPSTKHEINVNARAELSCPCHLSCRRVGRIVATHDGQIWVSFTKCSWVTLYNLRHVSEFTVNTHSGYVDSLAVSKTGCLFIACPLQRRILKLSKNKKLTVLGVFDSLYPRGLAVSPDDDTVFVCMAPHLEGREMGAPSKDSCLMRFAGQEPNESRTIVNMDSYFGYPMKVVINVNGVLLVSDFGLKCLFVLDKGGHMLRTFSLLGGAGLSQVHALACNPGNSFFVVQGGSGTLSITELVDGDLGIFEEKSTSKKDVKLIKRNVVTSSMVNARKIALASGNAIIYVSLV